MHDDGTLGSGAFRRDAMRPIDPSDLRESVGIAGRVRIEILRGDGSLDAIEGENLVGDAGDVWYAQSAAGDTPTNAFAEIELGTAGDAPAKGSTRANMTSKVASSTLAKASGYPKSDDQDADNTGAGTDVVTWKFGYSKGAFTGTDIDRGIITNTSPGASEPVLTYFTVTAFTVTADDTVTVYVNHEMSGQ